MDFLSSSIESMFRFEMSQCLEEYSSKWAIIVSGGKKQWSFGAVPEGFESKFHLEESKLARFLEFPKVYKYQENIFLVRVPGFLHPTFFLFATTPDVKYHPVSILNLLENYQYLVERSREQVLGNYNLFMQNIFETAKSNGAFTLFSIQSLEGYLAHLGFYKTKNILSEMETSLRKSFKKGDLLFVLSMRHLLAFSPDCKAETVRARFENVLFQSEGLLIGYKYHIWEYSPTQYRNYKEFETALRQVLLK